MNKLLFSLSICLCGIGCLSSCSKQNQQAGAKGFQRPLPVSIAEVKQQDIPIYVDAIGHTFASNTVQVRPQVGGKIAEIFIKGGDRVKVGDPLYIIDQAPYQIALERARANLLKDEAELGYAKSKLERYENLVKSDFVSKLNIEEYQRDVKIREGQIAIDKAEIENAKLNLEYTMVVSPINGQVSINKLDIGNIVQANDPNSLVSILQLVPINVNFSIPQKDFQNFESVLKQPNVKFKVILPYGSHKEIEGELVAINNQFNSNTGTIELQGIVTNEDEVLWPQQFVKIKLYIRTDKNMAIVPARAVQLGQKGSYVYVLKSDMTVEYVPVVVAEQVGDLTAIKEGLQAGMKVVTDGQINLRPGAKVVIQNEMKQAEPEKNLLQQTQEETKEKQS